MKMQAGIFSREPISSSISNKKKQLKYYTPHILYEKKENLFILFDRQGNPIGKVEFQQNGPLGTFHLSNLQLKVPIPELILQEFLTYSIDAAIDLQSNRFEMDNIPLKVKYITAVKEYFDRIYSGRIDFHYKINLDNWGYEISCGISNPKVTHYVPQSYLRNFSSNKEDWESLGQKDKARIFCFDIKTQNKFSKKIKNVAWTDYFYSLFLEEYMRSTLEKNITPILKKIITSESIRNVTLEEKITLARYILLQWNRTEECRNHLKESFEKTTKILVKDILSHNKEKPLERDFSIEADENCLRMMHEEAILRFIDPDWAKDGDSFNLVQHLLRLEWGLIKISPPNFFYTSDNPVILNNTHFKKRLRIEGENFVRKRDESIVQKAKEEGAIEIIKLSSPIEDGRAPAVPGVEIYLPISPNLCLYLVQRQRYTRLLNHVGINRELVLQSNRYIYSNFDNFEFVNSVIMLHPSCQKKEGKRANVKQVYLKKELDSR